MKTRHIRRFAGDKRSRWIQIVALSILSCLARLSIASEPTVGVIDIYGRSNVSREAVLEAVNLQEGSALPDESKQTDIIRKLEAIPGVKRAKLIAVQVGDLTNNKPGCVIYVGVDEGTQAYPSFRMPPVGDVQLPIEIIKQSQEFERALQESIKHGDFSQDDSRGYALVGDKAARAIQEKFVYLADQYHEELFKVLQTSSKAEERAIAALIIGFSSDKNAAVHCLIGAANDSDAGVRNNAIRSLSIIIAYAQRHPELSIEVPKSESFLALLSSLDWTDRNKAMVALLRLSENRDEKILAMLRNRSILNLSEMAKWQYRGHAMLAALLLGRIAHMSDEETINAYRHGQCDTIIVRAVASQSEKQ